MGAAEGLCVARVRGIPHAQVLQRTHGSRCRWRMDVTVLTLQIALTSNATAQLA